MELFLDKERAVFTRNKKYIYLNDVQEFDIVDKTNGTFTIIGKVDDKIETIYDAEYEIEAIAFVKYLYEKKREKHAFASMREWFETRINHVEAVVADLNYLEA